MQITLHDKGTQTANIGDKVILERIDTNIRTDRKTDRHSDKQTDRQIDTQTDSKELGLIKQ